MWLRAALAARQRAAVVGALVGAGALGASTGGIADASGAASPARPLFRFGLIADIQHCDCDDATNFAGTETRRYRSTPAQAGRAVAGWNALREPECAFVLQLGDLIDGQNAGGYGAGLSFDAPQSDVALEMYHYYDFPLLVLYQ